MKKLSIPIGWGRNKNLELISAWRNLDEQGLCSTYGDKKFKN